MSAFEQLLVIGIVFGTTGAVLGMIVGCVAFIIKVRARPSAGNSAFIQTDPFNDALRALNEGTEIALECPRGHFRARARLHNLSTLPACPLCGDYLEP